MAGIVDAAYQVLKDAPNGLTTQDLCIALRQHRLEFALLSASDVRTMLQGRPEQFLLDQADRWLVPTAVAHAEAERAVDEPVAPPATMTTTRDFVVFDLEATSNDPATAHILQIAAVRLGPDLRGISRFDERFVRAPVEVSKEVTALTGISDEEVTSAPLPAEVLPDFIQFSRNSVLVAHNGTQYDGPVLRRTLSECDIDWDFDLVDSLDAASVVLPMMPSRSMESLREHYHVEAGEAHRAGADVDALVQILRRLREQVTCFPQGLKSALGALLGANPGLVGLLGLRSETTLDPRQMLLDFVRAPDDLDGRPRSTPFSSAQDIHDIFGPSGPLVRAAGERHEQRRGQAYMATSIWEAFTEREIALIEGPTGIGKTLAYLVPAVRWASEGGGPIAVSTHTKALQDQLLRELRSLQKAQGLSHVPWSFAILKGRRNYLCLYNLSEQLRELGYGTPYQRRLGLAMLSVWAFLADQGYDDEFAVGWVGSRERDPRGEIHAAVRTVRCDESCTERRCAFYQPCYYFRATRRAEKADVVAMNHALLLSSQRWTSHFERVVLDEAHDLEDSATDALTLEAEAADIAALLRSVYRIEKDPGADHGVGVGLLVRFARAFGFSLREAEAARTKGAMVDAIDGLEASSVALHIFLHEHDHKRDEDARYDHSFPYAAMAERRPWLRAVEPVKELVRAMRTVASSLDQLRAAAEPLDLKDPHYSKPGLLAEARARAEDIFDVASVLEAMLGLADQHNRVYLLEGPALSVKDLDPKDLRTRVDWTFRAPPIEVASELNRLVFSQVRSAVLTSATLTVSKSFDFVRRRLGLDKQVGRLVELIFDSPFDYKNQALLAMPGHLPAPRASTLDEYMDALSKELVRYVKAFDGRTLALFTSRHQVEVLADQTNEPLNSSGFQLLAQKPGTRPDSLVRTFKGNPKGLLAGVRTFWEGIDIPGERLSHVWIAKLPFPNMGDPLINARSHRIEETSPQLNSFEDYLLPLTVIQFKQGFGRLIRSRADRGAVVVGDRRLRASMYRDVFLESLPGPKQTEASDLAMYREIAEFLHWPLDESLLEAVPLSTVDQIIARYMLGPGDDEGTLSAKLRGGLELFRLYPPPINDFRQYQLEIMLAALKGDALGILPTGAGKSLCFQLPALLRSRVTLVVSPLVALMKDQVDRLRRDRGLRKARAIVHSVSRSEQEEIFQDIQAGRCRLLYLAPERLRDQGTVKWLQRLGVDQVVIDEAHCVSLWGPTFRPEFLNIKEVVQALNRPPVLALTATATLRVRKDIERELDLDLGEHPSKRVFASGFDRKNLFFGVEHVQSRRAKDRELVRILGSLGPRDFAIVYVARKRDAERLAWMIDTTCRIPARAYHAGLDPSLRSSIQEAFTENGAERLRVIVATKAFGMGVDKPDVRYVIHYDMPDSIESYYQEAGRAGRDQKNAFCVLLHTPRDQGIHEFFIQQSAPRAGVVKKTYDAVVSRARTYNGQAERRAYIDLDELSDEVDVSETTLRVILHHLDRRGHLRRAPFDYGPQARVKLRQPPKEIISRLELDETTDPAGRDLAIRAISALAFVGADERKFDTLDLATRLGSSPVDLEGALLTLSQPPYELLIYRSWNRGMVIDLDGEAMPEEFDDLFTEQRKAARERLAKMSEYVSLRGCRREYLLRYFNDSYSRPNCGKCDNCVADPDWPWAGAVVSDADLEGGVDPEWEILRAVGWAEAAGGRFSRKQVELALRGREKYGKHGEYTINPKLLVADFFGRLQYIGRGRYKQAIEWLLLQKRLIEEVQRQFGTTSYTVLALTREGRAAHETRRLPDREPSRLRRARA